MRKDSLGEADRREAPRTAMISVKDSATWGIAKVTAGCTRE